MRVLRGKRALVTGAASGIGRAIAVALAREGTDLFLVDVDAEPLQQVANEARSSGVAVTARVCDLAQPSGIDGTVDALIGDCGAPHILVNNAGILHYGPTDSMTAEQWDDLLAVNLRAPIRLVQRLLPMLTQYEEAHIVNVCSLGGLIPTRHLAAYSTTKYALVGLSLNLRAEYGGTGLGVSAICPGFVRTPIIDTARKAGRITKQIDPPAMLSTTPQRVAAATIRAIKHNRRLVLVTPLAYLTYRLHWLAPGLLDRLQHRRNRRRRSR